MTHQSKADPKAETCTQVEERYYLQYKPDEREWKNYYQFPRGFKTEKSVIKALKKVEELVDDLSKLRVLKQTRTIVIVTTTEEEVLNA